MTGRRPHVAVIGAGIAGLAAAHEALEQGARVTVFEAGASVGGKIQTAPFAGVDLDTAADAFLTRVPWATDLCHELGLGDHLVSPAVRTARIFSKGSLRPLPDGHVLGVPTDLDALAASGLVSDAGVRRAAEDLERPDDRPDGDETVGAMIRRRLGDEVLEHLVGPLIGGINAGNVDQMSSAASTPQFVAAASMGPSLIASLRTQREAALAKSDPSAPIFHTLPGGLGRLTAALAARIGADSIRCGTPVREVAARPGGYEIVTVDGPLAVDAVIVATPADVAASLLGSLAPEAARSLETIEFSSVSLVALAIDDNDLPGPPAHEPFVDSGFLVPRTENLLITACSWSSNKFEHLRRPGTTLLRVSVGRHDDGRHRMLDDDQLLDAVRGDIATTLGVDVAPKASRISHWPYGLPQYRPGHLDRITEIEADLAQHAPGVRLAGASLRGVGIPACVQSGRNAATAVLNS